jgi:hypothetical protein
MADRYSALTVILEKDTRSDDADCLMQAIAMLKGVLSVTPKVSDTVESIAYARARGDLSGKLWSVLYPEDTKTGR